MTQHWSPRLERGGTGEGLGALLRLVPLSPPCSLVSARSRRVHAGRTAPVLDSQQGCTFPCREHPGVCQAHTSAVQNPKQHPKNSTTPHFCILSRVWKRLRGTHHGLCFQQEWPCPSPQQLQQSRAGAAGEARPLPWDEALIFSSAAAHRPQPRLGFSCCPSGAVPVPPRPRSRLVGPHGDKNTSPAAAHLVPETSLGNSNKKLKIKGRKEIGTGLAPEVRELKTAVI